MQISAAAHSGQTYGPYLSLNAAGRLAFDGCDGRELALRFGTPLWVISERTIRHNYRTLLGAFRAAYPETDIVYASKANHEPAILRVLKLEGSRVDAITKGHIALELRAGFRPKDIVFNGNNKTIDELTWALRSGIGEINVDSLAEMEMIAELQARDAPPIDVSLRLAINTTLFSDDPDFARYWAGSKFGMSEVDAVAAARIAQRNAGLRLRGLHNHVGFSANYADYSPERDLERHRRATRQTLHFASTLRTECGALIERVNLGGGFRIGRPEGFGPRRATAFPSVADYAAAVAGEFAQLAQLAGLERPHLLIEPGGFITSDAVLLLGQVGFSKDVDRGDETAHWVFLDNTTAYQFVRRMSSNFYHHVVPVEGRAGAIEERQIAGPACSVDAIATDLPLPPLQRGDLVAILDQGSYCEAITTDFCAIPVPAAVLVCDGAADWARRRETVDDISARYLIPDRLQAESAQ